MSAISQGSTLALPDRLAGAVWGHLVGDAVGVPYEFKSADEIGEIRFGATGTHDRPPGTWSDDGSLMLALLDSLLIAGFDTADQARRAVEWYRLGAY
ncbi:MAG TPA: ADP-ribosylglycohydrolase family protein, partial [Candidatus Limnocylindrales bacterium]|nr:ADP-ribosylglycohydrolase family protein [Candidatus Limnocylindrales bacterium]